MKNKGITLIALVITIIVLLILAGISVAFIIGENGIISRTQEAAKKQEMADIKEKIELGISSIEFDEQKEKRNLTMDILAEKLEDEVKGTAIKRKETDKIIGIYSSNNKEYTFIINAEYKVEMQEKPIEYDIAEVVKVGDSIEYTANGYSNWKVLKNDGKNITIISEGSPETLRVYGQSGYNSFINDLNSIAQKYLDTEYADSSKSIGNVFGNDIDITYLREANLMDIGTPYWIAKTSTGLDGPYNGGNYNTGYNCAYINNTNVAENTVYIHRPSINGTSVSNEFTYGTRPVVILKSSIMTTGKNSDGAWKLVK